MRETLEHRDVMFSIPHNDDGVWHYRIHPKRERRTTERGQPHAAPAEGFATREAAVAAAKRAIDAWLARVPLPDESQDLAFDQSAVQASKKGGRSRPL